MKLCVMGPNLPADTETFHVHAAGCRDLHKPIYNGYEHQLSKSHPIDAETDKEVVEFTYCDIIDENEMYQGEKGWQLLLSEFKFFPCTQALKYA